MKKINPPSTEINPRVLSPVRFLYLVSVVLLCAITISWQAEAAGTWTRLVRSAPSSVGTMLLLSDGTVMAQNSSVSAAWYRLTPDSHGSYVNGTWSTIAAMHHTRLYFSSDVLQDGRVFVAGAEYGTGTNSAEVYDPLSNSWTMCPPPPAGQNLFFDSNSKILANGNVLIAPVNPATSGGTVIYNVAANSWIVGPKLFRGFYQDEASWVKLPDDSILTIDPFGQNSERYIPALNQWVDDGVVPVQMFDSFGFELGGAFLLPNGKAIFFGATGHTAIYTPSGDTSPGSWVAGPDFPNAQGTPDAAAAMMVNGKILCVASPVPTSTNHFPTPTSYYEYDYVSNNFNQINAPGGGTTVNIPTYYTTMLDLPDGSVLYSHFTSRPYVYRPDGSPLASGKPAITSLLRNANGSYHLTGTLFNGITEGAAYGDDAQMDSNYPLVRLTNSVTGNIYYCRTFNWSSTGVMTSNTPVTTEFALPAGLPVGNYSLVVVANGNSSDPISFSTAPPAITSQPKSQTAYEGDAANFTLSTTGSSLVYQWRLEGNPLDGETNASLILPNVVPSQAGNYSVFITNFFGSATSSNALLTVIPTVPLPIALDASNLDWTTASGLTGWHGLTNVSHDGFAAGRSGSITNGQVSDVNTSIVGPQTLTFWWKVSSQTNSDMLAFYVNDVSREAISGEVDWQQRTYYLPGGLQTVEWTYSKDASGSAGQDKAWLDQVTFTAGGTAPFLALQPVSQAVIPGSPVSFSVTANGTPALQYQWLFNGATITDATNASFTLVHAFDTNSGQYSVIVSNDYGFTNSSIAQLAIVPLLASGNNTFGQSSILPSLTNIVAISAGGYHNLALRNDGAVIAWGDGINGQCDVPADLTNAVAIAAGGYHSLALLDNGTIMAWGDDSSGQTDTPALTTNIIAIAAGGSHSLALRADGTVIAWGDNSWGQTNVPLDLTDVVAIAGGGSHSLALKFDGTIAAWGSDLDPYGTYGGQIDVPSSLAPCVAISAGGYHSLAVKIDGTVAAWGDGGLGQVAAPPGLSNVVAVAAGGAHSLALKRDGTVAAWGDNSTGQLPITTNLTSVIAIAAGSYHSLSLFGPASPALQLMSPVLAGRTLSIPLPTERGKTYFLEFKDSLVDANWMLVSGISGNGGTKMFTDSALASATRFYRVRQQ